MDKRKYNMTQKEKAEAYDKAIEAARCIYNNMKDGGNFGGMEDLEVIFPELAESDDERIRKKIINLIKEVGEDDSYHVYCFDEMIAWLEKQGKKKSIDKVETKFKAGDWIIHNDNKHIPLKIIEKIGMYYRIVDTVNYHHNILIYCINENYHLWTIQDAKAGDVLVHNSVLFIFMGIENGIVKGICTELSDTILNFGEPEYDNDYCPATNEQRDLLFQKMREAGYEWDREKKELRKIEQKPVEWHREDEQNLNACLGFIPDAYLCRWLTDIIHVKYDRPSEWSEEDEEMLNMVIKLCEQCGNEYAYYWLKSLKERVQPHKQWKPSEIQKDCIEQIIDGESYNRSVLIELFNDLKKL